MASLFENFFADHVDTQVSDHARRFDWEDIKNLNRLRFGFTVAIGVLGTATLFALPIIYPHLVQLGNR
jgi:hypothetical protein